MDKGIHFIAGLPRSGSTLLSALLRQNPQIHANITSPVGSIFISALHEMSEKNEGAVFINDARRREVLRGIVKGFYYDIHTEKTVFDTNRLWCSKLPTVSTLYPEAKIICCVRDVPWIYDSVERLIRRNALQPSKIFNFDATGTVYDRFDGLNRSTGLIGFAWTALRQAYFSEEASKMLLVTFDTLTQNPEKALEAIYRFVGMPAFKHDFNNIEFDATEFDQRLGTPGLHTVGKHVRKERRTQTILPPELFQRVAGDNFCLDQSKNVFGAKVV